MSDLHSEIRRIVREEIAMALGALDAAADQLDVPYETSEIDSRAYQAGRETARQALSNLKDCWAQGHQFKHPYGDTALPTCWRCGTSSDPFKEESNG